jgi:uncharacterized protein
MELPVEITPKLVAYIEKNYRLNINGLHGWHHWVRVWENGQRLAQQNGADLTVVALFAFTHDMARCVDHIDPGHGARAAQRIKDHLQGKIFHLSPQQIDWLVEAVRLHTKGLLQGDLTVMTCWDSDRLDLGRAGIRPATHKLCTPEARDPETIAWAYRRSLDGIGNRPELRFPGKISPGA